MISCWACLPEPASAKHVKSENCDWSGSCHTSTVTIVTGNISQLSSDSGDLRLFHSFNLLSALPVNTSLQITSPKHPIHHICCICYFFALSKLYIESVFRKDRLWIFERRSGLSSVRWTMNGIVPRRFHSHSCAKAHEKVLKVSPRGHAHGLSVRTWIVC